MSPPRTSLLALLLLAPPASANDSSFGGSAADLIPLRNTVIVMRDEDILFEEDRRGDWSVTATYHFVNPSRAPIDLQMGFPESRCPDDPDADIDCSSTGEFLDLKTVVRGVEVPQHTGKVSMAPFWSARLGKVYLYDVRFAPGEEVEIVHRYRVGRSGGIEGDHVDYLTTTGRLWGAPIARARFTVVLRERPWAVWYNKPFQLLAYTEKMRRIGDRTEPRTEIVLETRSWVPNGDFSLETYAASASAVRWLDCPGLPLEERFLRAVDDAALRRCRNLPYARHGRPFKDPTLRRYFYGRKFKPHPELQHVGTHVQFVENPDFDEAMLDASDRNYIHTLEEERRRRKQPVPVE